MNNRTKIYELIDPITNQTRYIGKTTISIKRTLNRHLCDKAKTHKTNWIKYLLNNNLVPIINEIDEVSSEEWVFWEQFYIALYKSWGFELTNSTEGGEGNCGNKMSEFAKLKATETKRKNGTLKCSELTKLKIGIGNIDKKRSNETKLKMSISRKGREVWNKGKNTPIEVREKQSKSRNRYFLTNEGPNKGVPMSESAKAKLSKIIEQYDLDGNLIRDWKSISEASRELNISTGFISSVCKGKSKQAKGFKWKYKNV